MKITSILLCTTIAAVAQQGTVNIPPRQPVPEAVMVEAQKATQVLMNQVVKGNIDAAFKHMHPKWKKIEARKNGGIEKLNQKIRDGFATLRAKGFDLKATQAKPPMVAYEVDFGLQKHVVNGVEKQAGVYKQWMVFVPTVSLVTAVDRNVKPPKTYEMRLDGFQVALCEKGKNDWSFIDGAHLKAVELRQLFPFLPKDEKKIGFPKRGGQVLKER